MTSGSYGSWQARLHCRPLAIGIALTLVVGACASTPPSNAPTTGAPAATTPAAATATSGGGGGTPAAQFCQGVKLTFFPGGTPGGGFETVVYNGAKAAEEAFGPTVTYTWSDWDPAKMISQFSEAMASKPDGIAVMGHPGDDAFDPLIDQARGQGILVTVMNTELQKAEAGLTCMSLLFATGARQGFAGGQ